MSVARSQENLSSRRVTLITDPFVEVTTGLPWVLGQDYRGAQYQIMLDALPPGVDIQHIMQNQVWFVDNDTTAFRLSRYAGNINDPITISGTNNGLVISGTSVASGTVGYYISVYDTTNQPAPNSTLSQPIGINTFAEGNGITLVGSGELHIQNTAVYNVQFSAQFVNTEATIRNANIWLRMAPSGVVLSGTSSAYDVPFSAGQITVPNKHGSVNGQIISSWNYVMTIPSGNYLQFWWQSEASTTTLQTIPAGTTPTTPVSPSIIATIQQVTNTVASGSVSFIAASGITQLSGDVTAGPGYGNQTAILQSTTNVQNIISNNNSIASISGSLVTVANNVATLSGNVATLSGSVYNTKYFNIYDYGTVDRTGVVDSTAAVAAAQTALKTASGGMLYFPPGGVYKIQTGVLVRNHVNDRFYGIEATDATLKFTGSGIGIDTIIVSGSVSTLDNVMAPVTFRAIDLSLVTAGGIGVRHGNRVGAYYDGRIINGSAGPDTTWPTSGNDGVRGWQFTNISGSAINWTEQTVLGPNSGHHNCYIGCEFDTNNTNPTSLSFAYNTFQRYSVETNVPGQRGIVVRGSQGVGAQLYNGNFTIVGNNGNNTNTSQYIGILTGTVTSGTNYVSLGFSAGTTTAVYDGQIVLLKKATTSGNPQALMVRGNNPVGSTTVNFYQFTTQSGIDYTGGTVELASTGAVVGWPGITASGWSSGFAYDTSNWRTSSVFWKMEGAGDYTPVWNVPLFISTSGTFDNFGHLDFDTYSTGIVQMNGYFEIDGRYNGSAWAQSLVVSGGSMDIYPSPTIIGSNNTAVNFYQTAASTQNLLAFRDGVGTIRSYFDSNGTLWNRASALNSAFKLQTYGDSFYRFNVRTGNPTLEFGPGTSGVDTFLLRSTTNTLAISGALSVTSGINIDNGLTVDDITATSSLTTSTALVKSSLISSGTVNIYPAPGTTGLRITSSGTSTSNYVSLVDSANNTVVSVNYLGAITSIPVSGITSFQTYYRTEAQPRIKITNNPAQIQFGPGGSTAVDTSIARTALGTLTINGRSIVTTSGSGTATLSAGTVTVTNDYVTSNSQIFLTAQDNNTTGALRVSARTAGTSFTITSSNNADTGVVAYLIYNP